MIIDLANWIFQIENLQNLILLDPKISFSLFQRFFLEEKIRSVLIQNESKISFFPKISSNQGIIKIFSIF